MRNRGSSAKRALFVAAALTLAACSSTAGVSSKSATPISGDAPSPPTVDEGTAPTAPGTGLDATGLPDLSTTDPDTTTGTLDNGLRYLLRENDNPGGKVELRLVIDAGSGLEDDDQVGGAHFLEHMLFNGTERFPKNELIDVLRSFGAGFGADINASTSRDETIYTLTVPNDDEIVDTALDVLEDWLSAATIAPDDVDAERGIVLDEWRARAQTADGRVFDEVDDFFLAGTAYDGHTPIGGSDAIESITAEALRRFYDDWYRPDNAAVIVVGDIDVDRVEDEVVDRFADAEPRGATEPRPVLEVTPSTETVARVVGDVDLADGFAFVTLPTARRTSGSTEEITQLDFLEGLAFSMIATRLENDALRGTAPYEAARVSSSSFVRELDAPEISVDVDGEGARESVRAVVEEFERVRRFGFGDGELDRAVASLRSSAERNFDGRDSRQDASFADEYVRHVLEGEWYVTSDRELEYINEVLDRATVESVADVFVARLDAAAAHVFVALPSDEIAAAPTEQELVALVDEVEDAELDARESEGDVGDAIMERPDPVAEDDRFELANDPFTDALDPLVIEFANGARVSFNTTTIVDNEVFFEARSPGGLIAVADADVADAQALSAVIARSGVADFDRVALDAFLDDKSVSVTAFVDPFEDGMIGSSSTADLEVMMQLVNRLMAAPRVDQFGVDRYVDDQEPFAADPSIDAGYAEFVALTEARYDDARFKLPTVESLATVDREGVERVAVERFANAADWDFAFSGDFDVDEAIDLARSYIGSLPGSGDGDPVVTDEPPPPSGAVVVETQAGVGETANVSFLFTASASAARSDDIVASVVGEIVSNRLTDFIREELGDSYSPFATIDLGAGPTPATELYISVTTAPDLIDEVSEAVLGQLADLRDAGPTAGELDNAIAAVTEQLNFINNGQINDEVLNVLVDPAGNASFDEFVDQGFLIREVSSGDVDAALDEWVSPSDYIEVRVRPRG